MIDLAMLGWTALYVVLGSTSMTNEMLRQLENGEHSPWLVGLAWFGWPLVAVYDFGSLCVGVVTAFHEARRGR